MLKYAMLGIAASALMISAPAAAEPDGNLTYKMKKGDTLIGLAQNYFLNSSSVDRIVQMNRIKNPRLIPVGANITIPRRYLRYAPVNLEVQSLTGPVQLVRKGQPLTRPSKGLELREGDEIRTGRKGFVTITGYGNSRISLPSNSKARFIDARRYLINGLVDVQVKILEGRGNVTAPKLQDQERYRVGNPVAVTAVRGTQFRVGYDTENDLGLTEVVEGDVLVRGGAKDVATAAGFGVSASSAGVNDVEELLPAPELVEPGRIQTDSELAFALEPINGATGYRTQIAKDAGFLEVVGEVVSSNASVTFESLEDGRYNVRSRAIAQSGLEGQSKVVSFRRKRLGVSASAGKSDFADAFKFAWNTTGSGNSFTAFQLWEKGKSDALLIDEIGLTDNDLYVSALPNGTFEWRVATFQMVDGEPVKVWSPKQELNVAD